MALKMTPTLGLLFGGLFGGPQEREEYLHRLEEAARWLAEAEASNKPTSNQKEKGWIN